MYLVVVDRLFMPVVPTPVVDQDIAVVPTRVVDQDITVVPTPDVDQEISIQKAEV